MSIISIDDAGDPGFADRHIGRVNEMTALLIQEFGPYAVTLMTDVLGLLLLTAAKNNPGCQWEVLLADTISVLKTNVKEQAKANGI